MVVDSSQTLGRAIKALDPVVPDNLSGLIFKLSFLILLLNLIFPQGVPPCDFNPPQGNAWGMFLSHFYTGL